jgi:hypothetical protein
MGKYEPLTTFLRKECKDKDYVEMTFDEIQKKVIGGLPPSARYNRAFWSNNDHNNVMTKAWLKAGFRSTRVDMNAGKLTFRRHSPRALDEADKKTARKRYGSPKRHPLIGAMKGTVWIAPGTDLTQPAMPEWGEVVYGGKTWDDFK